jgi:hypothetical protein
MKVIKLKQPIMKLPPGGQYTYKDDHISLSSDSVDTLARKLGTHRLSHNKPIGDPMQDVMQYIYDRWPYLCSVSEEKPKEQDSPLSDDLYDWIMSQKGCDFTSDIPLNQLERAKICSDCPFNKPIDINDFGKRNQYERMAVLVTGGRMISAQYRLGACTHHKHDNRIVCAMKKYKGKVESPEGCWVE